MYFGEFKKAKEEGYNIYYYNKENEEDEGDRYEGQHKEWEKKEKVFIILKMGVDMKAILNIKTIVRVLLIITMDIGKWGLF